MHRSRWLTALLLLLVCALIGAAGGVVLARRHSGPDAGNGPLPTAFHEPAPIAVGDNAACELNAGAVDCWGVNGDGLLGTGVDSATGCDGYCTPQPAPVAAIDDAVSLAAGNEFACALLRDGTVDCWGANNFGQLGTGSLTGPSSCEVLGVTMACSPRPVAVALTQRATAISAAESSACAVLVGGGVSCWGAAADGVLGDGSAAVSRICSPGPGQAPCSATPVAVDGIAHAQIVSVGQLTACALLRGGSVDCWGDNGDAQLGDGSTSGPQSCAGASRPEPCSLVPVPVHGLAPAVSVSVGSAGGCAVLRGGGAECWGDASRGALGTGSTTAAGRCGPTGVACSALPLAAKLAGRAASVSVGDESACALLRSGGVSCWGAAADGALGLGAGDGARDCVAAGQVGDVRCVPTPTALSGLGSVTALAVGVDSSCAMAGATSYCWGQNGTEQLGLAINAPLQRCATATGPQTCSNTPQRVQSAG